MLDIVKFPVTTVKAPVTLTKEQWPPNYQDVYAWRQQKLRIFKDFPDLAEGAKDYYKTRPVAFINHWCTVYEPRNAGSVRPVFMPFVLFQRQADLIEFIYACLQDQENGLVEKSREMGATWACAAFSVWAFLFLPGAAIGWGSKDRGLVDELGNPSSIFEKIRILTRELPPRFWPKDFSPESDMMQMRIINPDTYGSIIGDIGDNIGRGGRTLIYFCDESAHYVHPELIDAALTTNTRVRIDISSVHGLGTVFHRRRESGVEWVPGCKPEPGRVRVFVMDWQEHPEKDQNWYDTLRAQKEREGLLHVFAQEVDRDYAGSVEGVIIPAPWVKAAIDAHIKLNFDDSGNWCAALDVADEGEDTNALAMRKGVIIKSLEEWGERDTGVTARRAVNTCKEIVTVNTIYLQYDCNGVGAGVKAETNRLLDEHLMPKNIRLCPWDAGSSPLKPEGRVVEGDRNSPLNKDFYQNLKAQGWWMLRRRFECTYRAINDPSFTWEPDDLISIPSTLPLLRKLEKELSQPTMGQSARLKFMVNKKPEGTRSPNLADAVMMDYWPVNTGPLLFSPDVLMRSRLPVKGFTPRKPRAGGRFGYAR